MQDQRRAYVTLEGELDLFREGEIAAALPHAESIDNAVINLSRATYIDSLVLGMLVGFRRRFVGAGGDPRNLALILPAVGTVRRTFELTGLTRLFATAYIEKGAIDADGAGVPS